MSIIGKIFKEMKSEKPDLVWTNGGDHVTGWDPNKIKNLKNTGKVCGPSGIEKVWEFDYEYDNDLGYRRHHTVFQPEQGEDFGKQVETANKQSNV